MSGKRAAFVRWLKFNAVGAIGIGVQLVVLTFLKSALGVNYLLATALAVEATVVHNFFWHEHYTWADRGGAGRLERLLKFNLTNGLISIAGNLALMNLFAGALGINYFVANLLSITGCSIFNFVVSDRFVFRLRRRSQSICACRSTDQMSAGFFSNG